MKRSSIYYNPELPAGAEDPRAVPPIPEIARILYPQPKPLYAQMSFDQMVIFWLKTLLAFNIASAVLFTIGMFLFMIFLALMGMSLRAVSEKAKSAIEAPLAPRLPK